MCIRDRNAGLSEPAEGERLYLGCRCGASCLRDYRGASGCSTESGSGAEGGGTVSYTHLDVYKRQGLHRWCANVPFPNNAAKACPAIANLLPVKVAKMCIRDRQFLPRSTTTGRSPNSINRKAAKSPPGPAPTTMTCGFPSTLLYICLLYTSRCV